jgi:hypothetical protein
MAEKLANLGYLAISKETSKGVPASTPSIYLPIYDENLTTDIALDEDNIIAGNKAMRYQTHLGMRNHQGEISVLAEPTTASYILNMLLTKGSTSGGSDPYTHPFTLDNDSNPKSYTLDIAKGGVVTRFSGVEASELNIEFDENKMIFKIKVSALKSFIDREISAIATATITLKTNYDPAPTAGILADDVMRLYDVSAGTYQDLTVLSVDDDTDITFTTTPSDVSDGDLVYLRPATPSFSTLPPFTWARTEFRFGATASAALSASQTRLEKGSKWILSHAFEADEGSQRSGSFDPATLVRLQGDAGLEAKIFFDIPEDMNRFLTNQKRACVIRHFSGSDHELRITINNLRMSENPTNMKTSEVIYSESKYLSAYDTSDGQMFDVKLLNALSTF